MKIFRIIAGVCLALCSPILLLSVVTALAIEDLCFAVFGSRRRSTSSPTHFRAATVVIPNWNGRDLLEKFLPSVLTAVEGNSANEVIEIGRASCRERV